MNVEGSRARGSLEGRAKRALGQALRALAGDVVTDGAGYVVDVADNLLPDVSLASIEAEFNAGAGGELRGKMRAPWSSSALAVNSFAPWRDELTRFRLAGLSGFASRFAFERKCDHGVRGEWPHLDVLFEGTTGVVGVESKCLEYTRHHSPAVVSDAYWALQSRGDRRATSRWFAALEHVATFARLDAYQLVKHYLGLVHSFPNSRRTLVYLYWEAENDDLLFQAHRDEIRRFVDLVSDDATCSFLALSYREHWAELEQVDGPPVWLADHLGRLRRRYAVVV